MLHRYNPIPRQLLISKIFTPIYPSCSCTNPTNYSPCGTLSKATPFSAAIIFMVFAIGSLLNNTANKGMIGGADDDDDDEEGDEEEDAGEKYHQLARTALSCGRVMEGGEVGGVRVLVSSFLWSSRMLLLSINFPLDANGILPRPP